MIAHRRTLAARRLCVLLLAAGGSRRLGRPKALVRLAGVPLVRRQCIVLAPIATHGIVLVTGARALSVGRAVRGLAVRCVRNRDWRCGQGTSLAAGVRALPADATHVLVVAVDQWQLNRDDLQAMARRAGGTPLAAEHDGRAGIPVVFPRTWFARLARLSGDAGARALLGDGSVRRAWLRGAQADLDTSADAARARRGALRGGKPRR